MKELITDLRKGAIDPDKALAQFDLSARHISDGKLSDLRSSILDCGFETLNEYEAFKDGPELVIVGARPGIGKSSFLLQIARNIAESGNVVFYSLEMNYTALKRRLLAIEAGISLKAIKHGFAPKERLQAANERLSKLQLYIEDSEDMDINTLRNKAIALHKQSPLKLVVVDYLQILSAPEHGLRAEEVGAVAKGLKQLASELGCPVLAAAQLNRSCEDRGKQMHIKTGRPGDYRPINSDIAESSKVERIADVIVFLSRQEMYDGSRKGTADIGVSKNRDGNTGWTEFSWSGAQTKFYEREGL